MGVCRKLLTAAVPEEKEKRGEGSVRQPKDSLEGRQPVQPERHSPSLQQSLSHGEEVHGVLDDAAIAWHQTRVDGFKEWPRVCMGLHLH